MYPGIFAWSWRNLLVATSKFDLVIIRCHKATGKHLFLYPQGDKVRFEKAKKGLASSLITASAQLITTCFFLISKELKQSKHSIVLFKFWPVCIRPFQCLLRVSDSERQSVNSSIEIPSHMVESMKHVVKNKSNLMYRLL